MRATFLIAASLVVGVACGAPTGPPTGQVVLYVDTDAPIAEPSPAHPTLADPIALFDALRVDVLSASGEPCAGCSRDFDVDASMFRDRRVSFGVVPITRGVPMRVRVRLYVRRFAIVGPNPDSSLDVTVDLPVVGVAGVVAANVLLKTDDVGQPAERAADMGRPLHSQVGTWAGGARIPCADAPRPGEACVPGGATWLGTPDGSISYSLSRSWHRLAILSPFFVSTTEVTAGQYAQGGGRKPNTWSGSTDGTKQGDWCTWSAGGERDQLPINCVSLPYAQSYCEAQGMTLPTSAQFTYLAGGLMGWRYAWGNESPSCQDAIWGRNGFGVLLYLPPTDCLSYSTGLLPLPGGPERPGSGERDKIKLGSQTVVDITGNVVEWVADDYQETTESCWSSLGVMADPLCRGKSVKHPNATTAHGGGWEGGGSQLYADAATSSDHNSTYIQVGFRCARPSKR